jgi:hypothetical protein
MQNGKKIVSIFFPFFSTEIYWELRHRKWTEPLDGE